MPKNITFSVIIPEDLMKRLEAIAERQRWLRAPAARELLAMAVAVCEEDPDRLRTWLEKERWEPGH